MGWKIVAAEKEHREQLKFDYDTGDRRNTTTIDDKLKRPVVKLAPNSMKLFLGRKTRPAMLAPVLRRRSKTIWNMLSDKQDLNF